MTRRRDPAWLRVADRVFAACLWCFPRALRQQHGTEMRQVFRDRCREVAGQPARIAHLLFAEMLPDTVASAGSAHWSAGVGEPQRRHGFAFLMLLALGGILLFQDEASRFALDWGHEAKVRIAHRREVSRLAAEEAQVRSLADALAAERSPASGALAAYLYHALYGNRIGMWVEGENLAMHPREYYGSDLGPLREDGARATRLVGRLPAGPTAAWVVAAATAACEPAAGCDRAKAVARLVATEPDNAYAWAQAFKLASLSGDARATRDALSHMAVARHYDDHVGTIRGALFAAARRWAPDDPHAQAVVARVVSEAGRGDTSDLAHDARVACNSEPKRDELRGWMASDATIAADCLRYARLLAASDGPWNAWLGWREIARRDPSAQASQAFAQAKRLAGAAHVGASPRAGGADAQGRTYFYAWDDAEWNRWATVWTPGTTEREGVRRWHALQRDDAQYAPDP